MSPPTQWRPMLHSDTVTGELLPEPVPRAVPGSLSLPRVHAHTPAQHATRPHPKPSQHPPAHSHINLPLGKSKQV
eukprot:4767213-Karenia_brevis.AAC.1